MAVVFDKQFVLSLPDDALPARNSRIGHRTWTRGLMASDVTASSAQDDFPADAPLRPDTFERWRPTSTSATWEVDLGSAQPVSYVGIAAHTLGESNASVLVEYSQDGGETWQQFSARAPGDDRAIMFLANEVAARNWRLTFESQAIFEVGVIYLGPVLVMQRPIYGGHTPVLLSRTTTIRTSRSRSGQFLGQDFRRRGYQTSASFSNLEPAWLRREFEPFIEDARIYPYFFAWRPTTYPREVAYVWTADDIAPQNSGTRELMDVSWDMVGFDE